MTNAEQEELQKGALRLHYLAVLDDALSSMDGDVSANAVSKVVGMIIETWRYEPNEITSAIRALDERE